MYRTSLLCLLSLFLAGCAYLGTAQPEPIAPRGLLEHADVEQMQYMIDRVYGKIPRDATQLGGYSNPVIVVLWEEGRRRGIGYAQTQDLETSIDEAVKQARVGSTDPVPPERQAHIHLLQEWVPFDSEQYDHGNHALRMTKDGMQRVFWGSYGIETNRDVVKVLQELCEDMGLTPQCAQLPDMVTITMSPVQHFGTTRISPQQPVSFYRGKELDTDTTFDEEQFRYFLNEAYAWLYESVLDSGELVYQYYPSNGNYSNSNNMIRQLMGSRILAQRAHDDPVVRELHQRNLEFIFDHRYDEDGEYGYIFYEAKSKLGAIAMMLRVLVASPFYEDYQEEARKLANTIEALQEEDGGFSPWWIEPNYAYDKDYLLTFYSGEGLVGILEYYMKTGEQKWLDLALKSGEFYLDRYAHQIEEWYYPAYVPRHSIAWNYLYKITEDPRWAQGVFTMNDKLIDEMQRTASNAESLDVVGRYYNPLYAEYGSPHSSSDGVYVDGLAYAYELAVLLDDQEHIAKYRDSIVLGVHNLGNLQYLGNDLYFMAYPERARGAIRTNIFANSIRIDTTQHMIDGFAKIGELIDNGSFPGKRTVDK